MKHITDDDLERYYLGMIPKDSAEAVALEEHLLACAECVARAEASDDYVDAIRAGIIAGNFDLEA
jgi:anti-sigma factor RsiW